MRLKIVCIIIIVAMLGFIWGNSLLSKSVSSAISSAIAGLFGLDTKPAVDDEKTDAWILRKVAHFLEFMALGTVSTVLMLSVVRNTKLAALLLGFWGMGVALIDETIQIFSSRGPTVRDIWIDICGFFAGSVIVAGIFFVIKKLGKNNKTTENRT